MPASAGGRPTRGGGGSSGLKLPPPPGSETSPIKAQYALTLPHPPHQAQQTQHGAAGTKIPRPRGLVAPPASSAAGVADPPARLPPAVGVATDSSTGSASHGGPTPQEVGEESGSREGLAPAPSPQQLQGGLPTLQRSGRSYGIKPAALLPMAQSTEAQQAQQAKQQEEVKVATAQSLPPLSFTASSLPPSSPLKAAMRSTEPPLLKTRSNASDGGRGAGPPSFMPHPPAHSGPASASASRMASASGSRMASASASPAAGEGGGTPSFFNPAQAMQQSSAVEQQQQQQREAGGGMGSPPAPGADGAPVALTPEAKRQLKAWAEASIKQCERGRGEGQETVTWGGVQAACGFGGSPAHHSAIIEC
jgi:hypothetical protein